MAVWGREVEGKKQADMDRDKGGQDGSFLPGGSLRSDSTDEFKKERKKKKKIKRSKIEKKRRQKN